MTRVEPGLGEIQETLLIPLYGRARDARARRSVLNDRRAVELVDGIDYDFSGFKGPSLSGSVLRSAIFDGWVRQFLREHPAGTVVDIGTGLNTRFDRLDNGSVRWFDVDLPDTIALRRRFFTDRDRCTMVSGSVLETDWFDTAAEAPEPYLFVIEAVLVYFTEDQARTVVTQLAERFPGALLAFDTGGAVMMRNQERNGSMKAVTARMQWVCEEPKRLESWGMQLLDSRTFATPQPEVGRGWPARYRYGLPALARIAGPAVNSYKLNLFRLG
ncbi:O-methyltransferase domain-containing protein [Mycolicibacterium mageritense DSM 44476 = CIP 104973]|uniref:Tetracenomycin C synthesis protein n=1 Tax=Mycolicibacterium mageritense TaxID=53462 RepID=A0ABM7HS88_MYCME|nr:class I SAM-dependent methyltransferase [Mycolicibacterium mageritense]MCC9180121.1 class I SAM-dependent methyltransferase [Mycolicibacterium mageritense]BBX33415.1 tetracenomycin C synthesis protein [Mycolicibacterium mageritense]CDO21847.1 O-methyltransferase domain-containing protein [Mycolicibacterium mageritense DSM 44476 = CIP 104973]